MEYICQFPFVLMFWEIVVVVCEFDVVEFDVGSGLVGKIIVGLNAFNKNIV
jgi:hypothetical protein